MICDRMAEDWTTVCEVSSFRGSEKELTRSGAAAGLGYY